MAKDPAFLFYTGDFTTGTQFFSDAQVGIFLRLLMAQHQHGRLSEQQMLYISKTYDKLIYDKFIIDEVGLYYNERLDFEVKKRQLFSESRSKNRAGKTNNTSLSYDNHMENENENKDINTNTKKIPTFFEFFEYAKSKEPLINEIGVKNKYDAWIENKWRNGFDKPIKNWKSSLLNTLQYITKNKIENEHTTEIRKNNPRK